MKTTELKYWVNGVQVRGKDFYTLTFRIKKIGVMFALSISLRYLSLNMFKLQ